MKFLCFDGATLINHDYEFYEISFWQGIKRLLQPKYRLHRTMGRPIIVINKVWGKL